MAVRGGLQVLPGLPCCGVRSSVVWGGSTCLLQARCLAGEAELCCRISQPSLAYQLPPFPEGLRRRS